uniref:Uncharacterized protein n=2 Tax=unclassified Mycobacterium TaxID=2642494 RepID=A0A5Q5BML1_MYCSS
MTEPTGRDRPPTLTAMVAWALLYPEGRRADDYDQRYARLVELHGEDAVADVIAEVNKLALDGMRASGDVTERQPLTREMKMRIFDQFLDDGS